MDNKKILAAITAVMLSGMSAFSAYAEDDVSGFDTSIGLASSDLSVQNWNNSLKINEGVNTVTFTTPKDKKGVNTPVKGIGLLVIDLEDCYFEVGKVSVDSILIDGNELGFDKDLIIYGADDGMENDNFRIELFSSFGETKENPPFDAAEVTVNEKIEVTFTVSRDGYGGGYRTINGSVVEKKNSGIPVPLTDYTVEVERAETDSCTTDSCTSSDETSTDAEESLDITMDENRFSIQLKRGIYDFTFSKEGHVPRKIYGVKAGKKSSPSQLKDIDLRVYGDVNGDGTINVTDISIVSGYVKQIKEFSDDYQAAVADVCIDNTINVTDISMIAGVVKGIKKI